MTQLEANQIVSNAARCTEATLKAFGVEGIPTQGSGCLEFLTRAGLTCKRMLSPTFVKELKNSQKNLLILTKGHAMALVNGVLVDTERKGFDGRKIEFMWEVTK